MEEQIFVPENKSLNNCDNCGVLFLCRHNFCSPKCKIRYYRSKGRHLPIPNELRQSIFERDNFTCKKCGSRNQLSLDHIVPQSKGGKTETDNLQTLCLTCNRRKNNHDNNEPFGKKPEKLKFEKMPWGKKIYTKAEKINSIKTTALPKKKNCGSANCLHINCK